MAFYSVSGRSSGQLQVNPDPFVPTQDPNGPRFDPPGGVGSGVYDVESNTYLAGDSRAIHRWSKSAQNWVKAHKEDFGRFFYDASGLIGQAIAKRMTGPDGNLTATGNVLNTVSIAAGGLRGAQTMYNAYQNGQPVGIAGGAATLAGAAYYGYGNSSTLTSAQQLAAQSTGSAVWGSGVALSYTGRQNPAPSQSTPSSTSSAAYMSSPYTQGQGQQGQGQPLPHRGRSSNQSSGAVPQQPPRRSGSPSPGR
ncbi:hypothetical protein [Streptomyces sp. CdTB01]|uniref:hypothetical protein n=1 Tax=Streptomyces sp. CdTB01 TaxID=1725411 RepID=UPI00073A7687|nr:hypothetical protein [Streptomyces sp. CdTB01]ALV36030.1 hypothetical protein AS200_31295 [Streptomyces sp. CdTB01]